MGCGENMSKQKPAWTKLVQQGMWTIVARSATVMAAEGPTDFLDKETKERVLAAVRYATYHWAPADKREEDDDDSGSGD
jgi:hypothetical protein